MYASWTYRLRFIKKHLLMFLLAFGWLLIQTQVAVASHQCSMDLRGEVATIQHMEMMAQPSASHSAWSVTPPAVGPPATIRYCRFRE
ncbi:hypothetical protein ACS0TU_17835 [Enterobacter hormaechei]